MAKKHFNMKFEDIRRNDTPVNPQGLSGMEGLDNPDDGFVDIDLDEEDDSKSISNAANGDEDPNKKGASNEDTGDNENGDDEKNARREALKRQKEIDRRAKRQADSAVQEAREEVAGEMNTLKKKVADMEAETAKSAAQEAYDDKVAQIQSDLAQASEDGDHEKVARLTTELTKASNELAEAKLKADRDHQPDVPQDLNDGDPNRKTYPRAQQFIRDNEDWWTDPEHEEAVEFVKQLDRKIQDAGHDPNSSDYWNLFNKNFDKKYPDLRSKGGDDIDLDLDDEPAPSRKKSTVAAPTGPTGGRKNGKENNGQGNVVKLTQADKQNMVAFGLDPLNPEHLKAYAQNKVAE